MSQEERIDELILELLETGATPEAVCEDCPELLPEVRRGWKEVCALETEINSWFPTSDTDDSAESPEFTAGEMAQIPGYEMLEILGRGGAGIVYLARHSRLDRQVAVKMLLAGRGAKPRELDRFWREVKALAGLRHPNIVPIYDVGDHEGRLYFTMEFLEGGSLSKKLKGNPLPALKAARLVATLADGIHAAHENGIVHRDLTPTNVLFASDGTPKVTDFGLARRLDDKNGLTLSGMALGTPGYMSPEQAGGRSDDIGPRADVYALGALLYKMLTGRPPFQADSTSATIQQLLSEEPVPPSRLNSRTPRDLETICLKCLSKEPRNRYDSALALADDLRRFERGESIVARRISRLGRLARWARRRPGLAAALVSVVLLALTLVATVLWWHVQRTQLQANAVAYAEVDLRESQRLLENKEFQASAAVLQRAKDRLGGFVSHELSDRLSTAFDNLELVKRLDAIRLVRCSLVNGHFDRLRSDREYEQAFRSAGFGPFEAAPQLVASRINSSQARAALVAALDDWAVCAGSELRRNWLLSVTRLADPDPWRDRVRNARLYWDLENLKELTRTAPVEGQSVQLLVALGERLHTADPKSSVTFLRRVQQAYPDDFFANFWAGYSEEPVMAVGYNRVAQSIRPNTVVANRNLADSLLAIGRTEEAVPYLRRVLAIDPKDVQCRTSLAESSVKVAIAHQEKARALQQQRQWAEAIVHYRAALDLVPDWSSAHYDLAMALNSPGHRDEAVVELRKTLALDPRYPAARANLGLILIEQGKLDQAAVELRQAVKLDPPDPRALAGLREALARLGRFKELHAVWREQLNSGPPDHDARFGYAELCLFLKEEQEYCLERRELLGRFSSVTDPIVAERTGRSCLLLPPSDNELLQAVALTDRAVAAGRSGRERAYPYFLFAQGLARYREGRFDDAITLMNGEAARVMGASPRLILAMAQFRKGQTDEARKTLAAAIQSYDWSESKANSHEPWITHILRREAESLIGPDRPALSRGAE